MNVNIATTRSLVECMTPREALAALCACFEGGESLELDFEEVSPEEIPSTARQLLVHTGHMTRALVRHYGAPVDLHVLGSRLGELSYARKIMLALQETGYIVEYGLAKIDLTRVPNHIRRPILEGHAPLGSILMNHNILRRIQPRWYVKFPQGSSLLKWFGCEQPGPLFGRLSAIYCEDEPAIELLEVVTNIPVPSSLVGHAR